ncbi:hypothetical protein IC235_13125 [Hymenobacter sp. BT664]|uniref:RHS repeat-associated core domain-containing protein n=1 Tax=Hymenobacter montanus TaxID=2771359 RepID=A0A927BDI6_9BACT|nr:hypothetical protein [Hymenobacter montanus]MBD2768831.1 hypothetical protein [Hymenobacter montanus]
MFDADSNLLSQQTQQLSAAALNNYEALRLQVVVPQDGYVSAYVGNESNVDVFFDDVTVEHRQGLQVQETQYDPTGLELAGVTGTTPGLKPLNQYKFNGKEFQADLGLNWNHQDWRFIDLARGPVWLSVDPEVENGQETMSPYVFNYDNPIRYADANGRQGVPAPNTNPAADLRTVATAVINSVTNVWDTPVSNSAANGVAYAAYGGDAKTVGDVVIAAVIQMGKGYELASNLYSRSGNVPGVPRKDFSPAAQAAGFQGKGNYPGVDKWRNVTLKPGTVVHAGEPGGGNFATTGRGLQKAAGSASKFSQGLQVGPHPVHGYRPGTAAYEIKSPTPAAMGTTLANPQHGSGGLPQLYIPNLQDKNVAVKGPTTPFVKP